MSGAVTGQPGRVVDHPDAVTSEWMTAALRAGGTDVTVADLRYERVGTGQIGASYRFHLTHDGAEGGDVPDTVVVKMAAGDEAARERVGAGYRREVGFYDRFGGALPVRTPRCWQAAISDDSRSFTIVLADAYPAVPGAQEAGCDLEQALDAVRNLAGLHAPHWNNPTLDAEADWLPRVDEATSSFMGDIHVAATEEFLGRYEQQLSAPDGDILRRCAEATHRWEMACQSPYSLVHGDYRLDNLMFPPSGPGVIALDWQTLVIGFPARDLAYFIATALTVAQRREYEQQLVAAYHERLVALGVTGYTVTECFADYRLGTPQGPLITVLGCMYATGTRTAASDAMFLSMARRSCAAIRDLATLELIPSVA